MRLNIPQIKQIKLTDMPVFNVPVYKFESEAVFHFEGFPGYKDVLRLQRLLDYLRRDGEIEFVKIETPEDTEAPAVVALTDEEYRLTMMRVAARNLVGIKDEDGEYTKLGSMTAIERFVEQAGFNFLEAIMFGWLTGTVQKQQDAQKKPEESSTTSTNLNHQKADSPNITETV